MAAKKKTKADEQTDKDIEFIKALLDYASKVPKEVYFSLILSYAWSKTHEGFMNKGDLLLGALGGFTLPSALQGDITANAWALSYLGGLGWNFVDQDVTEWLKGAGEGVGDFSSDVFDWVGEVGGGFVDPFDILP